MSNRELKDLTEITSPNATDILTIWRSGDLQKIQKSNLVPAVVSSIYVNVKDFGAVGDGVVDDTAAIQAAIDSLVPFNAYDSGLLIGTIFLPTGVYKTTAPLVLTTTQRLKGAGKRSTVIMPQSFTGDCISLYVPVGANGGSAAVESLTIFGNDTSITNGINFSQASADGANNVFFDIAIYHCGSGINLSPNYSTKITLAEIKNCYDASGAGIILGENANSVSLTDCQVSSGAGRGVVVQNCDQFNAKGCQFEGNGDVAVDILASETGKPVNYSASVSQCRFEGNLYTTIRIGASGDAGTVISPVIRDNLISAASSGSHIAINVQNGSNNALIQGNAIVGTFSTKNITVDSGALNTKIYDNYGAAAGSITDAGTGTITSHNI